MSIFILKGEDDLEQTFDILGIYDDIEKAKSVLPIVREKHRNYYETYHIFKYELNELTDDNWLNQVAYFDVKYMEDWKDV